MNRFSVIYLLQKQYYHLYSATHSEADSVLHQLATQEGYKPIGIYDAKTELFYWEPIRQNQYNNANIERQGKIANHIIRIAQTLRHHDVAEQRQSNSIAQLLSVSS